MISKKLSIFNLITLLLTLLILQSMLGFNFAYGKPYECSLSTFEPPDLESSYYTSGSPFYPKYEGQCTWYAWGRALEKTGVRIDTLGNAKTWYDNTSLPKGNTPRANSIAVWEGIGESSPGHVAFVEYIDGDTIYFTEANVYTYGQGEGTKGGGYDGYLKCMPLERFLNRGGSFGRLKGFIYLEDNPPYQTNFTQSIFYGAGSIVCPDVKNFYGCDKDIAKMHPNSENLPSTVVFQWKYDETHCPYLKIYTYEPLYAKVGIKRWLYNKTQEAYKAKLDGEGIVISRPVKNKKWFNIVVTSINPISNPIKVYATCVHSLGGNSKEKIDNFYVDVTGDYYWTGTASIMSFLYPEREDIGVSKDYVILFYPDIITGKKTFSSVQWYVSNSCSSLRLETKCVENNKVVQANDKFDVYEVSYKGWSEDNSQWRRASNCNSLPCTVTPDISGYIVLKIKGKPLAPSCVIELKCE